MSDPGKRPTLLNSSASAATAAEAAFRIDGPPPPPRVSRVVALDPGAATVIRRVAAMAGGTSHGASHFLAYRPGTPVEYISGGLPDVAVYPAEGDAPLRFADEMEGADMVFMVATADDGADAAAAIGEACYMSGITTGAVVFGEEADVRHAVAALRPHARVLLVTQDEDDVSAVLAGLRA
jgi:hypothetical protein